MANVHHNTYNDELIFAVNQLVKKALATYGYSDEVGTTLASKITTLETKVAALEEAVEALEDAVTSGSGSGGSDQAPQA